MGDSWYLKVPNNGWYGDVWVQSPVYNFTNVIKPNLYMDIKYQLTNGNNSVIVQYSTNGGTSWTTIGTVNDANWYNSSANGGSWNNNLGSPVNTWTHVKHSICETEGLSCVIFRVSTYNLYYNNNNAYFAFDNFRITTGGGDDISPVGILLTNTGNCGAYSSSEPVSVIIQNLHLRTTDKCTCKSDNDRQRDCKSERNCSGSHTRLRSLSLHFYRQIKPQQYRY